MILDCGGPFATVTLNRPEKRNALALDVMLEVTDAFRAVGSSNATGATIRSLPLHPHKVLAALEQEKAGGTN